MEGKVKGFLLLIILAIITSAIWISQMATINGQVTTSLTGGQVYNYTLLNGTVATSTTPTAFVSPSILIQILGLVPLGLWFGVAFSGFKLFKG